MSTTAKFLIVGAAAAGAYLLWRRSSSGDCAGCGAAASAVGAVTTGATALTAAVSSALQPGAAASTTFGGTWLTAGLLPSPMTPPAAATFKSARLPNSIINNALIADRTPQPQQPAPLSLLRSPTILGGVLVRGTVSKGPVMN